MDPLQTIREWRAAGLVKVKRLDSGDLLLRILGAVADPEEAKAEHPINVVFRHWKGLYSPKAVLDPKRRRVIRAALKNYSVEQLQTCITGYGNSPHHRGQNPTGTKYLELQLMLRDAAHVEAGIEWASKPSLKRVTADPQATVDVDLSHEAWKRQMLAMGVDVDQIKAK